MNDLEVAKKEMVPDFSKLSEKDKEKAQKDHEKWMQMKHDEGAKEVYKMTGELVANLAAPEIKGLKVAGKIGDMALKALKKTENAGEIA
tara:strand:+ start:2431 stop:2697 length:267 start_codon:yes stop_codon:yes gene_type:complete